MSAGDGTRLGLMRMLAVLCARNRAAWGAPSGIGSGTRGECSLDVGDLCTLSRDDRSDDVLAQS